MLNRKRESNMTGDLPCLRVRATGLCLRHTAGCGGGLPRCTLPLQLERTNCRMCVSENNTTANEKDTMVGLAAVGGHIAATLPMSSTLASGSERVPGHEVTIGPKTSGMIVIMCGQETAAETETGIGIGIGIGIEIGTGTETDTGIRGCTGMCLGCKMECLGASFLLPVDLLLTKWTCSVRGQIVRLLKEI